MTTTQDSQEEDSQEPVDTGANDQAPLPGSFGPREQLLKNLEEHPEQIPVLLKKSDAMLRPGRWGKITGWVSQHAMIIIIGGGCALVGYGAGGLIHHGPNEEQKKKIEFAEEAEQEIAQVRDSTTTEINKAQQDATNKIAKIEKEANRPIRDTYNAAQVRLDKGKVYVSLPVKLLDASRKKELAIIFENATRANPIQEYPIAWISDGDNDLRDGRIFIFSENDLNDFILVKTKIKDAVDGDVENIPEKTAVAYRVSFRDSGAVVIRDIGADGIETPGQDGDMQALRM